MPNTIISRRAMLSGAGALALLTPLALRVQADPLPPMTVTKDPSCGCCGDWIEHLRSAGFPVRVIESDDVLALKQRLGVPHDLASCHTAEVDGYVVEGHVPASAIQRLLAERPEATGLAVPGMPGGSPGMDYPGVAPERYEVVLFGPTGLETFARFRGARQV
ncbi:DUF411 domain-containing protein [Paracoccus sp. S-4012]|uniref:DUF411 domain-containing protein n=1 Tax=Paracoccus sp. S-4012 TaxID=2665648 RepID=UPI0012AF7897|nr:DUF411 domain-containing protein [Paracoccus sp. S-4012]MRX49400.1 DUF411 domain-containing protein [Paracoccus sp. S-4012]